MLCAGSLIKMTGGHYLTVSEPSVTKRSTVPISEGQKGVIVDHQGHDHVSDLSYWTVLVNDKLVFAWTDQIHML